MVHSRRSEEQVAETCPKNSNQVEFVGPVAGTKFESLRQDFVAKMASSRDGTCPFDFLQGLVAPHDFAVRLQMADSIQTLNDNFRGLL